MIIGIMPNIFSPKPSYYIEEILYMQCEHVNKFSGQCSRQTCEGTNKCPIHTHGDSEKVEKRVYRLQNMERRLRHETLSNHDALRSIREEVAVARMLLEERLNSIKTDADLISACGPINTLLLTIEKLTSSCLKLDKSVGNLLAKPIILKMASDIVAIILEELADLPGHELIVDKISERIIETMSSIEGED